MVYCTYFIDASSVLALELVFAAIFLRDVTVGNDRAKNLKSIHIRKMVGYHLTRVALTSSKTPIQ